MLGSVHATELSLVPLPTEVTLSKAAAFELNRETQIVYRDEAARRPAELLALALRPATGLPLKVVPAGGKSNVIMLRLDPSASTNEEGYLLRSSPKGVLITASQAAGLFYGTQTLLQLLPTEVFLQKKAETVRWLIPSVKISDEPVFGWRGMMLDVSRYFFTKAYVLRYLDMMAMHKMNVLHWHLVDDCGWRVEIKKYPKLTEIGGFRGKGEKRYGGFYTQEDIREIVRYAADRNIRIVPEIEVPAHTLAALVAYPWLGCTGKQFSVPTRHSISPEIYCAGKATTQKFLEDVMTEICELFPDEYIHVGGDEAKFDRWKKCPDCQAKIKELGLKNEYELQGWMTMELEKFLAKKGKRLIGWDEILKCGVSSRTGLMVWYRPKSAVAGAKRGNPIVMSLTKHAYFDTPESRLPGEPPAARWIPPISLQKAYEWDPLPKGLDRIAAKNILGASGCIWSDLFLHKAEVLADKPGEGTVKSEAYVDYLSLPRMAALAEVTWTPQSLRNYPSFTQRMRRMYLRYRAAGYNFRMPTPLLEVQEQPDGVTISATSPIEGGLVRYTLDGSEPAATSPPLELSVLVARDRTFKTATFLGDKQSLTYTYIDESRKDSPELGKKIGEWKSGQPGNRKPKKMVFDATGAINKNGKYKITFLYSKGQQRLEIDRIEVVKNNHQVVAKDVHHGITGHRFQKKNSYTVVIKGYETGASYKIWAQVYGDKGTDSNGAVFIRSIK
jgi:hexosaminidase